MPIDVVDSIPFASGEVDQIGVDPVQRVRNSGARVLILLADSNDGTQFLEALSEEAMPNLTSIIVNDAMRSSESVQRLAALPEATREMIEGVAPQAESTDPDTPFDPPGPFATQAFDCVTLIALAAELAESDSGANIAAVLPSISTGGQPCDTFVACAGAALEPRQIDYNGPSGLTDIGSTGDPQPRPFRRVQLRRNGPGHVGEDDPRPRVNGLRGCCRRNRGSRRRRCRTRRTAPTPCRSASCTRRP